MPAAKAKNKTTGDLGEKFAVRFLQNRGYKIIEKNYRAFFGEIDIIALDGKTLVFVEVKTRMGDKFGLPEEAVSKRKITHIIKSAYEYIDTIKINYRKIRIDVIALTVVGGVVERVKLIHVDQI